MRTAHASTTAQDECARLWKFCKGHKSSGGWRPPSSGGIDQSGAKTDRAALLVARRNLGPRVDLHRLNTEAETQHGAVRLMNDLGDEEFRPTSSGKPASSAQTSLWPPYPFLGHPGISFPKNPHSTWLPEAKPEACFFHPFPGSRPWPAQLQASTDGPFVTWPPASGVATADRSGTKARRMDEGFKV